MFVANDLPRPMVGHTQTEKPVIIELAILAMEELIKMAQVGEPFWITTSHESSNETLNEDEYMRSIASGIGPKPVGYKSEASRESIVVIMNHTTLVEILMDVVSVYLIILKSF